MKMVGTLKLKEENKMKKLERSAETRMAVYIYIYISYIVIQKIKNQTYKMQKIISIQKF